MARESTQRAGGSRWLTNPQMLVGLSALLLSVCGLFIAIYEATLIRRAQRASAWPHVEVAASIRPTGVSLWVRNTGVGPARVRAAALSRQDEVLAGWSALVRGLGAEPARVSTYRSLVSGRVLPAGLQRETIFEITPEDGPGAPELVEDLSREVIAGEVDVEICYCSVYDECWLTSLQDLVAWSRGEGERTSSREVDACDDAAKSGI